MKTEYRVYTSEGLYSRNQTPADATASARRADAEGMGNVKVARVILGAAKS